jgi:hypothetical protein
MLSTSNGLFPTVLQSLIELAESILNCMGISIDDYDQGSPRPGLTVAVGTHLLHKLFPHPTLSAPPARWGLLNPYVLRFELAPAEVSADKHFVMLIFYKDDDQGRFTHPPIPAQLTLRAVNSHPGLV